MMMERLISSTCPQKMQQTPDVQVEEQVQVEIEELAGLDSPWRVVLFNDEVHTFDEVITQLIRATSCTSSQAEAHAWTVHTTGKAYVYEDSLEGCLRVQSILKQIALSTEIQG